MRPPASLRGGLRRGAAPAVVLFTGLLASAGAALYVSRVVDAQQDARFNEIVAASAESLQRRMDAYVAKPIDSHELIARVEQLVTVSGTFFGYGGLASESGSPEKGS